MEGCASLQSIEQHIAIPAGRLGQQAPEIMYRRSQLWLALMSWAAFCLLAVPRKAITMMSCPQATRHLVLVRGSLISSRCSRLYRLIAVFSEACSWALPCTCNTQAAGRVTMDAIKVLCICIVHGTSCRSACMLTTSARHSHAAATLF